MVPFAFSLQDQVETYGVYVGLAAFFGLAVLSLLYFAQARELKRLRDWAGRAPERAQEIEARAVAQAEEALRQEPRTVGPAQPIEQPTAVTPAPAGAENGRKAGTPAPIPMGPRPATAAATLAQAGSAAAAWSGAQPAPAEVASGPLPAEVASEEDSLPDESPPAAAAAAPAAPADSPAGDESPAGGDDSPAAAPEDSPATGAPPTDADDPSAAAPPTGAPPVPAGSSAPGAPAAPDDSSAADDSPDAGDKPPGPAAAPPPAGAPAGDSPRAPGGAPDDSARAHERGGNGVPAEPPDRVPPAPIPRATPRPPAPRRVPAQAARVPSRSATIPPRRGVPGGRRPAVPGQGSNAGRMAVIAVVGVLVLAGAGFAATRILGGEDPAPPPNRPTDSTGAPATSGGAGDRAAAARPETVVAVLNGTPTEGLASGTRDKLIADGYSEEQGMIRTGNNTDQQRQDSVVLYRDGQRRQARDVASILDIDTPLEEIDSDTQALADSTDETNSGRPSDVAVILGADQSP